MKYTARTPRIMAIFAVLLMLPFSTDCGDEDSTVDSEAANSSAADIVASLDFDDSENDDEIEYGAMMRTNTDYNITIEYDKRFFKEGEIEALSSYFYAIQMEDKKLFDTYAAEFYMDYYLENAFGGLLDTDAYITQQHETFSDQVDTDDFIFSLLSVTSCIDDEDSDDASSTAADSSDDSSNADLDLEGVPALKEMFIELEGEDAYDEYWDGCKFITVKVSLNDGESTYVGGTINAFIVQLNGSYYICA